MIVIPDSERVHLVAEFLRSIDGPVHITAATAQALGELLLWHANLDSDDREDDRLILALARAFDLAPSTCNEAVDREPEG